MIRARVTDFRGIDEVEIDLDPIALVCGLNGAGKTSIAQGIGHALSGAALPVGGRDTGAGVLVHTGASEAVVQITSDDGSVRVLWPTGNRFVDGDAPEASPYAVGLISLATMPARDRAPALAELLRAIPDKDDLAGALAELGFEPTSVEPLWELIERNGWDGAVSLRRERGAELKGQWRQVTGTNYGSRVAAVWRPDLEGDEQAAQLAFTQAQRDYSDAVAAAAVSADERRRLTDEAEAYNARNDAVLQAEQRVTEAAAAYAKAQEVRQALPASPERLTAMPCPYCGAAVVIHQVSLVETRLEKAPATDPPDAVRQRRQAIADADGKLAHANDALMQARAVVVRARGELEAADAARQRIAEWPRAVPEAVATPENTKTRLDEAERRLAGVRQKKEADALHRRVENNETIMDLLGSEGLRHKKLSRVLAHFNDGLLTSITAAAGWAPVTVDLDMTIRYGGRPYALCSSSEQYRARVVLQVAMARHDDSDVIVIDGADILDAPARGGLFDMLEATGFPALVCMTMARREQVPDLAAAGLGRSYWLDKGLAQPVGERAEAA